MKTWQIVAIVGLLWAWKNRKFGVTGTSDIHRSSTMRIGN